MKTIKTVKKATEFTIVRDTWQRGGHRWYIGARLYNSKDGKQCCLGFYAEACGFPRERITDKAYFESFVSELPTEFGNLIDFYRTNDDPSISEPEREARLTKMFANEGVKVTFLSAPELGEGEG